MSLSTSTILYSLQIATMPSLFWERLNQRMWHIVHSSLVWERVSQRIWQVIHPRATWRYILCFSIATFFVFRGLFTSSPLLSSNLPDYTGLYTVGTIDIEAPVEPRWIKNATFKDGGYSAFKVSLSQASGRSDLRSLRPFYLLCTTLQRREQSRPTRIISGCQSLFG